MGAQLAEHEPCRQRVGDEIGRRTRADDLTAGGERTNARGLVEGAAEVVAVAELSASPECSAIRVGNAMPSGHVSRARPARIWSAAAAAIGGACEHRQCAVALTLSLDKRAGMVSNRGGDHFFLFRKRVGHRGRKRVPQRGRAVDIGEQECHRARRQRRRRSYRRWCHVVERPPHRVVVVEDPSLDGRGLGPGSTPSCSTSNWRTSRHARKASP